MKHARDILQEELEAIEEEMDRTENLIEIHRSQINKLFDEHDEYYKKQNEIQNALYKLKITNEKSPR